MATIAIQFNKFHNVTYLSSSEGKKLCQKASQDLPKENKYEGDSKDVIKFVDCIKSKSEEFGYDYIATTIGSDNVNIFETLVKLTMSDCKTHCDPKWADGAVEVNVKFCTK